VDDFSFLGFWVGKILGAILGYLVAGPVGMFFGLLIGNFFDRGLAKNVTNPLYLFHKEKRQVIQRIFFQSTFLIMGHIAKSDGRVTEREIDLARQLMSEMKLSKVQKEEAKGLFHQGKQPSFNLGHTLTLLKTHCRNRPELLRLFIDIQYRAACIDGLNQEKIDALNRVLRFLDFAPLNKQFRFYQDFFQDQQQKYQQKQQQQRQHTYQKQQNNQQYTRPHNYDPLASAYAILEVPASASKQEVKKAYRRLMSQNHPDKLIAKGLPEEMIKMATDKTQTISKAYDEICEARGWS
jgi:DnaJ like chaperone protein